MSPPLTPLVGGSKPPEIYGPRWFHRTEGWHKSVQWLQSYSVCKNLSAWQEFPLKPNRPMTMPLHFYGTMWFHRTWDCMNQSSIWGVTAPTRIWEPHRNSCKGLMGQWPCHCTSKGRRPFHRAWDGTNRSRGCGITVSAKNWVPNKNI